MIDAFVLLTPFLLLAVVGLLGFVGCASFSASSTPAEDLSLTSSAPSTGIPVGTVVTLTWSVTANVESASIDHGIGAVYTAATPPDPSKETGTVQQRPALTATYTLSGVNSSNIALTNSTTSVTVNGVAPAPTLAMISPNSGPPSGGTPITVTGTNFFSEAKVTLGGAAAVVTGISPSSITATTPAHAAGVVNVVVTNADGQTATLANAYTYAAGAVPNVTAITPNTGSIAGGAMVTINGTNFAAGASVTLGGVPATSVNVASAASITATTPAHAAGVVDVTVTNTDGGSGTLSNGYTYAASPAGAVTHLGTKTAGPVIGTTVSATIGPFPGAGKLVVVMIQWGGLATVTLSGAGFTLLESDNLNPQQVAIYFANNVNLSFALTVTGTLSAASSTDVNLFVTAYDNATAAAGPDSAGQTQGTGTSLARPLAPAGFVPALSAGDLIYAVAVSRDSGSGLNGALSAGTTPSFVAETLPGRYILMEDRVVQVADVGKTINLTATNTAGTATSKWYLFTMRIRHA